MKNLLARAIATSIVLAQVIWPLEAGAVTPAASDCVAGPVETAAVELFGTGTEVAGFDSIAGLHTALVLEPLIAPGTRHRVVLADGLWCDATTAFNAAWERSGGPDDPLTQASAYVQLAGAPYFDHVSITSANETAPNNFTFTTHARTNGVVARWQVFVDSAGVTRAAWTAEDFAVRPLTAEKEGLTALPGASESYLRLADGALAPQRGLPQPHASERSDDGLGLTYKAPDGMQIVISVGDSRYAPDIGSDTGVHEVDILRTTYKTVKENYEEFLAWGLKKGWTPDIGAAQDEGFVYINDALTAYCIACVWIRDDFQIHMSSRTVEILELLGYSYPDPYKAFSNVMGHEMFHNFQNAYVKPTSTGKRTHRAYSEGTARFQETLHSYSDVSDQDGSLVYADDSNGCNGFDWGNMDISMSFGPFDSYRSYEACYFWLAWYASEGLPAFVDLISTGMPQAASLPNGWEEGSVAITTSSERDLVTQLADFARRAITHEGYTSAPPAGGPATDWSKLLDSWQPKELPVGGKTSRILQNGGIMANEIKTSGHLSVEGPQTHLFMVRKGSGESQLSLLSNGSFVEAPGAGERVWVGAVRPAVAGSTVTLSFSATQTVPISSPSPSPSSAAPPTPIGYETHEDSGSVLAGSPTSNYVNGRTEYAFLRNCEVEKEFPEGNQGLDGWVFELPDGFDIAGTKFTLRATGPAALDVDAFVVTKDCQWIRPPFEAGGDEVDQLVPAGAKFLIARGWSGAAMDLSLSVTRPIFETKIPTTLQLGDLTAQYSDEAVATALLTDPEGSGVEAAGVSFEVASGDEVLLSVPATTGSDGVARASLGGLEPGSYELRAIFAGDDEKGLLASEASAALTVSKEQTALAVSVDGHGANRYVKGLLTEADATSPPVSGKTIEFFNEGSSIGCATTGEDGWASLEVPPALRGAKEEFSASFAGDSLYEASSSGAVGSSACSSDSGGSRRAVSGAPGGP